MLKLIKIALTGSIACGKSTALKIFKKNGAYIVSADEIVHKMLKEDEKLKEKIIDLLGSKVVENSTLNRKKIAEIVFENPELLRKLEKLIHPSVIKEIKEESQKAKKQDYKLFVVEIPLLFEMKREMFFNIIVLITAKDEIAKKRHQDERDFVRRKNLMMPVEKKEKLSTYIIDNNSTIENLEEKINKLSQKLK